MDNPNVLKKIIDKSHHKSYFLVKVETLTTINYQNTSFDKDFSIFNDQQYDDIIYYILEFFDIDEYEYEEEIIELKKKLRSLNENESEFNFEFSLNNSLIYKVNVKTF